MLRNREDCILRIGIIGNSVLGKAVQQIQCSSIDIMVYDTNPDECSPLDTTIEVIETCDLIFYCIPTEMNHHTSCDTTLLSEYISLITNPYKIICSTVPIGYSQSMECSMMILPGKEQWIVGMIESSISEEFKKRMTALRETCHKEGVVLDDIIQWASATELEAAIAYKTILSEAWSGITQEADEFITKKNINPSIIKKICTFLPDSFHDIHSVYHQIADTSFPILQHIIKKDREPMTTDKKISLVIGTRNDKLIEDVCRNLIKKDNIVILFSDTPILLLDSDGNVMKDVLSKTGSFRHKQFFPKLDYIWDFSKMDSYTPTTYTDKTASFIETMNKLELVKTHHCSLSFLSDHDEDDDLVSAFVNEYPEHRSKVEIIHVLFDKNERSDYILH
jgi:hypothetical protein